jgi:hypothetical protein
MIKREAIEKYIADGGVCDICLGKVGTKRLEYTSLCPKCEKWRKKKRNKEEQETKKNKKMAKMILKKADLTDVFKLTCKEVMTQFHVSRFRALDILNEILLNFRQGGIYNDKLIIGGEVIIDCPALFDNRPEARNFDPRIDRVRITGQYTAKDHLI